MKRRQFITLLGGATASWPAAARAQQAAMPVIGFMNPGSPGPLRQQVAAFRDGLKEVGFVEGQNVAVDYRFAEGHFDRLPALAADLVSRQVAVLVASGNQGAFAAKQATATIPIVFTVGDDPVATGLVASLNRPGGNLTGVSLLATGLEAKRLGLLHELVPRATTIAAFVNANYPPAETQLRDLQKAAPSLDVQLFIVRVGAESDFNTAFSTIVQQRAGALQVCSSPLFNARRQHLVLLAARHAIPAIYEWRDFAEAGGLMSYGSKLSDAYGQAALYAGRSLKGAKPADLPIVQATRFEFVINLNTAKALSIEVPDTLLARADEVIE
jgi:putative tryptophan/tyrosine transport system substrate-binding protein